METEENPVLSSAELLLKVSQEEDRLSGVYEERAVTVRALAAVIHEADKMAIHRSHLESWLGNEVENNRLDAEIDRHLVKRVVPKTDTREGSELTRGNEKENQEREL